MKLLPPSAYDKLIEPLKKVTINTLFARSVVVGHVTGKVFVDDVDNPQTYYVLHPYGMSLLFGDWQNFDFNESLRAYCLNTNQERTQHEWMQVFPANWNFVLEQLFGEHILLSSENKEHTEVGIVERNTRVNFIFDKESYFKARQSYSPTGFSVVRTDREIFHALRGSVVPMHFWNTADDFLTRGAGFSIFYKDHLVSTAYSSFVHDKQFELGIETRGDFRGKGFAFHACMALLDYCLINNYEPIWACRLENVGSYLLALKLGFKPQAEIPYYRLSK